MLSLADLEVFIKNSESGLLKKVEKGDFKGLVEIMEHLMALKEQQSSTDEMFEPLKQTIELLKTYRQELPETVFKQLEVSAKFSFSFFKKLFIHFYSVTIVCIFSPSLHPTPANPTSLPHLYPPP